MRTNTIKFAKVKPNAIIPSKRDEDAGYDIYPCFEEEYIMITPHKTAMIPCGIASAFSYNYVAVLKERGSTGTKGIAQRCGVIDSGYRGEWMTPITNTTDKTLWIDKRFDKTEEYNGHIHYPYSKAICQALFLEVPMFTVEEVSLDELNSIDSIRGNGKLGSSNK